MVGVKQVAIGECGFYFFFGVTLHYCFVALHDRPRFTLFIATAMFFAGVAALLQTTILSVALAGMFGGGILLLCLAEPFVSSRFHRTLTNIGNNTYGMYLWHIPIQLALFLTVPALIESATRSAWFLLSYLALVCVVARIGYLHFERPASVLLRRYGQGRSRHCQAG